MSTIQQLLDIGKEKLIESGNEYAKYERKMLLEEVLGCNYMYMLTHGDEEVTPEQEQRYYAYINRRCEHYPLQYMLGYANFMDFVFNVNENVLIPRNDTEVLVEQADACLTQLLSSHLDSQIQVLDLCCGSGCIGISLKLYHKEIALTLADISDAALEVAQSNLKRHQVKAQLHAGNLFDGLQGRYDMIVSNPPYIESNVIHTLMPEVKEHEPMLALDGGEDGLDFYRDIIADVKNHLVTDGSIFFEIGYNQGNVVSDLMRAQGFEEVTIVKDYAGLDRVVYGHL